MSKRIFQVSSSFSSSPRFSRRTAFCGRFVRRAQGRLRPTFSRSARCCLKVRRRPRPSPQPVWRAPPRSPSPRPRWRCRTRTARPTSRRRRSPPCPSPWLLRRTAPNRSPAVTIPRLNLTFNAFGGIIQWQTNPGSEEEWVSVGVATTSNSETVLSSANVGAAGLIGANIFYEVL
jgi:hypothetical protein